MLKYLTTGDAAHALRLSISAVREMALEGVLPTAAMTPRGYRLFRPEDVEELKRERAARPPRPGRPRGGTQDGLPW